MKPIEAFRNAASLSGDSRNGSTPSSVTVPRLGGSSAPSRYSRELFPAPEGPMMAAAAPGARENETSDRTVSGPRGVGYDFVRPETSSMRHPAQARNGILAPDASGGDHRLVDFEQPVARLANAVVRPDTGKGAIGERSAQRAILPDTVQTVGKSRRI